MVETADGGSGGSAFFAVGGWRNGAMFGTAGVVAAAVGVCGLSGLAVMGDGAVI